MNAMKRVLFAALVLAAASYYSVQPLLARHPHFAKTVTAKVGEVEAKLGYFTAPANEEHVKTAPMNAFNAGFATLTLSGDLTFGEVTLKAGEYTVGAVKKGDADWTMGLHQGKLDFGAEPDMAKVIKLDSQYETSQGNAPHIYFDILPGHGKQEGKYVLIWHFGRHYLSGVIS